MRTDVRTWRYIETEDEHEMLMNGTQYPVYGTDYICDRDGDILVPVVTEGNN
jgi:hypothetical protein